MPEDVLLVDGPAQGPWIAGRHQFHRSDTFIRATGARSKHHPFLHFEVCYYQAIDCCDWARSEKPSRPVRRASTRCARLPAANHLFRALHRRPRFAPRHRRVSQARAQCTLPRRRANSPRAGRFRKVAASHLDRFRRPRESGTFQEPPCPPMTATTSSQDPARRVSLLQGV